MNPATAGTVFCRNFDYTFSVDICIQYPAIAGTKPCQGNISYLLPSFRNGLSVDQCLKNPKFIETPACKFPAEICIQFPEYASRKVCAGNKYPAEVCASSIQFAVLEGCAGTQYPPEVCASSIKFAVLEGCTGNTIPGGWSIFPKYRAFGT